MSTAAVQDPSASPASISKDAFLAAIQDPKTQALIAQAGDGPYDWPFLFPNTKGWSARRQIRARLKLLKYIEPLLPTLLYPGERLRFVARGTLNSWLEQYFLGIVAMWLNRTLFLVTDLRVVLLNTNSKGKPKHMRWQIPYHQIAKFAVGGFLSSSVKFKLADRTRLSFAGTPKPDRQCLRQYVHERMAVVREAGLPFPHFRSRDNLCPACASPVEPSSRSCPTCQQPFASPWVPAAMSLAFPCLGDFYLGHPVIGLFELAGYAFAWIVFAASLAENGAAALPGVLIFLVFAHVFDAGMTLRHARKGLLPRRR